MSPEGIRRILRQQPFTPFRLVMSSGKEYEVRDPEMAWVLRNDILVAADITDNEMQQPARRGCAWTRWRVRPLC